MIAPAASAEPLADPADAGLAVFGLPPLPYPGLRPFEHAEWLIFFGRERMVDEAVKRLGIAVFVFVHGALQAAARVHRSAGVRARLENEHAGSAALAGGGDARQRPPLVLAEELRLRLRALPRLGTEGTGGQRLPC